MYFAYFPSNWKKAHIIFFRKMNKDPLNSKAYRPISLLRVFGKLLEKLLRNRIMTVLENNQNLDDDQHGFREDRRTVTALGRLFNIIDTLSSTFKYCALISFDVMGHLILCHGMFYIIDSTPLPTYLKEILKNYLFDKKLMYKHYKRYYLV